MLIYCSLANIKLISFKAIFLVMAKNHFSLSLSLLFIKENENVSPKITRAYNNQLFAKTFTYKMKTNDT